MQFTSFVCQYIDCTTNKFGLAGRYLVTGGKSENDCRTPEDLTEATKIHAILCIMEQEFEKALCLGSGIPYIFLFLFISVPNGLILTVLYRNPLRCFRKTFSVFLVFIAAVDLFNGIVVCTGKVMMQLTCAFGERSISKEGDIVVVLEYIGINTSILLVTAMAVDRFASVVYPHFYLRKVKPRKIVLCNTIIVMFSSIFASLQLAGISMDVYLLIDVHLHTTFPLAMSTLAYLGIFFVLRKRSRVDFQRQTFSVTNPTLCDLRQQRDAQRKRKFAITSFLILLCLVGSLVPYFVVILLEENCSNLRGQKWFFVLRELSIVFLFLNSTVNPFLTTFRINELKHSVKIVLRLGRQNTNLDSLGNTLTATSLRNVVSI